MSRRAYVGFFMLLAMLFVPTVLFLFAFIEIAPCCYFILNLALGHNGGAPFALILVELVHLAIWIGLFYLAARLTFKLSLAFSGRSSRFACQCAILLILIASSFVRVLGESDMRGRSGTYNFWDASIHYIKIYPAFGTRETDG